MKQTVKDFKIMKKDKIIYFIVALCFISNGCYQNNAYKLVKNGLRINEDVHLLSGLWKCTPATTIKKVDLTLEPVLYITGKHSKDLSVKACFSWEDGQFREYWYLNQIEFDEHTNEITLKEEGGERYYKGIVDAKGEKIEGQIYVKDNENWKPEAQLDFIRARDYNAERLFIARKPHENGSPSFNYQTPKKLDDGLQTASIFEFSKDKEKVYDFMNAVIEQKYGRIESLLIVKDNKLVLEEYFYDYTRTDLHNTFSCAKSFVSLAFGLVMEQDKVSTTDQSVFDAFPYLSQFKNKENAEIELKHVLSMRAGFQPSDAYKSQGPERLVENLLGLPLSITPGERFQYLSECPYFLGGVTYDRTGKTISELAKERIFSPMGINNFLWKEVNGNPHCESHLYMLPRDMAKIGLMTANGGKWNGKQIIPENWIEESTQRHVPELNFFGFGNDWLSYGYQWWHRSDNNRVWWREKLEGEQEHDMYMAFGYGGQFIFVVKDLNLIVSTTASDYNFDEGMGLDKIPMMVDGIVPLFK